MYLYFRGFWYTGKLWDWAHIENKDPLKYRHPLQLHYINFISTHKKGPHMKGQRKSTSATQCFVANCIVSCRWVWATAKTTYFVAWLVANVNYCKSKKFSLLNNFHGCIRLTKINLTKYFVQRIFLQRIIQTLLCEL